MHPEPFLPAWQGGQTFAISASQSLWLYKLKRHWFFLKSSKNAEGDNSLQQLSVRAGSWVRMRVTHLRILLLLFRKPHSLPSVPLRLGYDRVILHIHL